MLRQMQALTRVSGNKRNFSSQTRDQSSRIVAHALQSSPVAMYVMRVTRRRMSAAVIRLPKQFLFTRTQAPTGQTVCLTHMPPTNASHALESSTSDLLQP